MTIGERQKYIFISKICKWIGRNINYKLGDYLLDKLYDKWDRTL